MVEENILDIDDIDSQIIQILQKDPNITHRKIAERLNRSQPTIGLRIKRMTKKGLISHQFGINVKKLTKFKVAKLEMYHRNPSEMFELVKKCAFIVNCFRQTGKRNIMVFVVCPDIMKIDYVIDFHFRNNPNVSDLKVEFLTDFCEDYIVPMDIRAILQGAYKVKCGQETCPCFKKEPIYVSQENIEITEDMD